MCRPKDPDEKLSKHLEVKNKTKKISHFLSAEGKKLFFEAYSEAMKALPGFSKEYDIRVSFGSVKVYQFGEDLDSPVILFPGRSSSTPMWEPNIAGISKHKSVLTFDSLGEPGKSTQEKAIVTAKDQADWIQETFTELNIIKAHIVGVSVGGWLAFNYINHFPQKVASVTLLDPVNVFVGYSLKIVLLSLGTLPFMPDRIREMALSKIAGGADASENVAIAKLIALGMKYFKVVLPNPVRPDDRQLKNIKTPVLVLMAGKSVIHNANKATKRAKKLLSNVQAECWESASHAINGEFAEEVNKRIFTFIEGVEQNNK